MIRMSLSRFALVATVGMAFVSLSTVCTAESVRFHLKSGDTITGELLEPNETGDYRIRVGDRIVVIPQNDVYTTLEVGAERSAVERPKKQAPGSSTKDVLRQLQGRLDFAGVAAESVRVYRTCLAEAARGDWDFSIKTSSRLLQMEPSWPDPQILRAQLMSERGQAREAISLALWLETSAPDDSLALQVSATCYRRGGFARRAAQVSEKMYTLEYPIERAQYERVQLWWPVDQRVAEEAWAAYVRSDSLLRSPWCREGKILHRAELALSSTDWEAAQAAVNEMNERFPWARLQSRPVELRILERRLRESETSGHIEEALVAIDTLQALDSDRDSEWKARRVALIEHHLRRGLSEGDFVPLRSWAAKSAAVFRGDPEARRRISERFQSMGCRLVSTSQLELAEHAFNEAKRWDVLARPADIDQLLRAVQDRVRDDVAMRRTLRVLRAAEIIRDAYPERRDQMLEELSGVVRDELREVATADEISNRVAELRGIFLRNLDATKNPDALAEGGTAAGDAAANDMIRLTTLSYASLSRYFPHEVGTRWVYEVPGGRREEHEVTMLTPLDGGGWKIDIEIRPDNVRRGHTRTVYMRGGDVLNGFEKSPPAEVALRYPLSEGAKWSWEKGAMRFTRELSRPNDPLALPGGTIEDYLVVHSVNAIDGGADRQYTTWQKIYYGAGIGIVKIESEDKNLGRTLLEFFPVSSKPQTAATD